MDGKCIPQMVRDVFQELEPFCCDSYPHYHTQCGVQVQLSLTRFGHCSCLPVDWHLSDKYSLQACLVGPLVALCLPLSKK